MRKKLIVYQHWPTCKVFSGELDKAECIEESIIERKSQSRT